MRYNVVKESIDKENELKIEYNDNWKMIEKMIKKMFIKIEGKVDLGIFGLNYY